MSFSFEVKKELIAIENKPCCALAQSYGFLLFGRTFSPASISLMTDRAEIARAYAAAVTAVSGAMPEINCSDAGRYTVRVTSAAERKKILRAFGYDGREVSTRLNFAVIHNECCRSAFIRGAFLACGSITDPEKEYHIELPVSSRNLANDFVKVFDEYDGRDPELDVKLIPGLSMRGGGYVIYFNDSASVEDFLSLTGAHAASMAVMNAKVYKDIRNNVNRRVNFETANLLRSCDAAAEQIRAIGKIKEKGSLSVFPEDIRQLAALRLREPEMSLRELGDMMEPPLSRTAVNYRLKKILKYAESL
ncbi:MAG: DNA-binding protein WhiA [Clostridia bacterium]|nr:DNA-binding protein WhiA [Clostridia bacterium]